MNLNTSNEQNIIERDIHCPYCKSDQALLISGITEKKSTLQLPAYGLKYLLCVVFTFGIYALIHGIPCIEKKRTLEYSTYGFCPKCGKTYNAGVPVQIKAMKKESNLYRSESNKFIFGICGGIAEYTGLSLKLVRAVCVIYGLLIGPVILYILIGAFDIIPPKPMQNNN